MHCFYLKWLLLDPKQVLGKPWIVWPPPGLIPLGLPQLQIRTFLNNFLTKGIVIVHKILEVVWLLLWLREMRAVGKCCIDCLSCPNLSRSLEVKSNTTARTSSSINIKSLLCKSFVCKEKIIGWRNSVLYILTVSMKDQNTLIWNKQ